MVYKYEFSRFDERDDRKYPEIARHLRAKIDHALKRTRDVLVYKVFYKNFEQKKGELIGILVERRRNTRGTTLAESGLRWAKLTFGRQDKNGKAIFVVPNEMNLGNDPKWLTEKWMFTKEELLGLAKFVEQGMGR